MDRNDKRVERRPAAAPQPRALDEAKLSQAACGAAVPGTGLHLDAGRRVGLDGSSKDAA